MAPPINNTVVGALKLLNLPDVACYENFEQLLKAIETLYAVEIPSTITNVVVSSSEPGPDHTDSIWVRKDASGNFLGVYVFSDGKWKLAASLPVGTLVWWNDSRSIPDGFQLLDVNSNYYTSKAIQAIRGQFVIEETSPEWFSYCAIVWVGY